MLDLHSHKRMALNVARQKLALCGIPVEVCEQIQNPQHAYSKDLA